MLGVFLEAVLLQRYVVLERRIGLQHAIASLKIKGSIITVQASKGLRPFRVRVVPAQPHAPPDFVFIPAVVVLVGFGFVGPPCTVGILGDPVGPGR